MGTTDLLLQLKSYECIAQQILWMKLLVIIAFVYRLRIFTWQILEAWRSALANNHTAHIEREQVWIQVIQCIITHHYLSTMISNFFSFKHEMKLFFQLMKNRLKKSNSFKQINFLCMFNIKKHCLPQIAF